MKNISLVLLLFIVFTNTYSQTNYYISPTGDNSNLGTSISLPWKTIQYAADNVLAGDTINIMAGTYNEKVDVNISGSIDNYITFRNYENDISIISGSNLPAYQYLMKIEDRDYICVSGIKFQDYQQLDALGIIVINSSNITIENNEFTNIDYSSTALGQTPNDTQNSQPIIVFGRDAANPISNLLIKGNRIHDCEVGWSECISVNGNIDGFEISHNQVYDNTNIGIVAIGHEGECATEALDQARNGLIHHNLVYNNPGAYTECAGIYIDGAAYVTVENNISYSNNFGIEVGCENNGNASNDPSANHILVRNNLVYNNTFTGIALGGYNYPTTGKVEYTTIENNTCFNNDTGNNYQGEIMVTYTENSTVENNIFYTNNPDKVLISLENTATTLAFNYNLYYVSSGENDIVVTWNGAEYNTFSDFKSNTSQDANSIFSDPLFSNTTLLNLDIHIPSNSPAVNAGNPNFQTTTGLDIDNESRINDNRVDLGCDEYFVSSYIKRPKETEILNIYPNPTKGHFKLDKLPFSNKIILTDVSGRIVYEQVNVTQNDYIDISHLKKGIYFLKVQANKNKFGKIIKE